jgi:alkylation response protein AidB-like acyl-CoA dehydrogenase
MCDRRFTYTMDLRLTDEQQFLRESVRGIVAREAPLSQVRDWALGDRIDHVPALELAVRQGWTGIGIPEQAGGQGGSLIELAILAEELGRGAVPADGLYATLLSALALSETDSDEASAFVETLAGGERMAALLHPGGSPADTVAAEPSARLVLGALGADLIVSWDGDALELYDGASAHITERRLVDRTRTVADVTVSEPPLERFDGIGPAEMRRVAAWAAVLVAADALGAAERMLELTVEYVGQRVQFGVPVGSFQAVKHAAAEMVVGIEGTRGVVQYAAWAVGAGEPGAELDAWVAKARAARSASMAADRALFLHGAVGYTWEHDLQLLFKRAKSDAEVFGGPGLYDDRIADALELTIAQPVKTTV